MKIGESYICMAETDLLVENRVYQITSIKNSRVVLDFDLHIELSDLSELFKPLPQFLKSLSISVSGKHVKDKVHALISYIYYDDALDRFFIAPEIVNIFENTNDYHLILRVMQIILTLMDDMDSTELEQFGMLIWDDVWDKIGKMLLGE